MFKKMLASLGKGSASVDLSLYTDVYSAGDEAHGEITVYGGNVEQTINSIEVGLFVEIHNEQSSSSFHITSTSINEAFVIDANEKRVIPFSFQLPYTLPLSNSKLLFYFDTHLDISTGIDKKDLDYIQLMPTPRLNNVFLALKGLGFYEKKDSGKLDKYGQEFAFYPTDYFSEKVNEMEIRFALQEEGIKVWLEVDIKEGFGEIELTREVILSNHILNDEDMLVETLQELIHESIHQLEQYQEKPSYISHSYDNQSYHYKPGGVIGSFVSSVVDLTEMEILDEIGDEIGDFIEDIIEDVEEEFNEPDYFFDGDDD